jgi:hypothetical protein
MEKSGVIGEQRIAWMIQLYELILRARAIAPTVWDRTFATEARMCVRDFDLPRTARLCWHFLLAVGHRYAQVKWLYPNPSKAKCSREDLATAWNQQVLEQLSDRDRARRLARDGYASADAIIRRIQRMRRAGTHLHRRRNTRQQR